MDRGSKVPAPALGEGWRNFVKRDLDAAITAWCKCENRRKRPRTVDELNIHNVRAKYDATQFLLDNPPISDEEAEPEESAPPALPQFGRQGICGNNYHVYTYTNDHGHDYQWSTSKKTTYETNGDDPHSPGSPRLGNFCTTHLGL